MEDEIINKVKHVLNEWNPLGENASNIEDLKEYEIEAIDILFYIDLEVTSKRPVDAKKQIQRLIKDVLEEAFNIDLTIGNCKIPAEKIYKILHDN